MVQNSDTVNEEHSPGRRPWRLGPALLVTAAFIGPGTVTKATSAGALFGYTLLWAVAFSVVATIIFQEMASRLGTVTGGGIGEAVHAAIKNTFVRIATVVLIVTAIIVGNAAYQAGNIAGAAAGASAATGLASKSTTSFAIGLIAAGLLMTGYFRLLQRVLIGLVVAMSVMFLFTAMCVEIDWKAMAAGWAKPSIPGKGLREVLAIIGTTVVPYNLFLHASASAKQWSNDESMSVTEALRHSRLDTMLSVSLGGIVTAAIMITATAAFFTTGTQFASVGDAAIQLEPLLGSHARWLFGAGLFAAGLTSAITAPLAAAFTAAGCFRWPVDLRDWRLRFVMLFVISVGVYFSASGSKPTDIITIAQVANGLLLPLVAFFLIALMNNASLLGKHRNGRWANVLAVGAMLVVTVLGIKTLYQVF